MLIIDNSLKLAKVLDITLKAFVAQLLPLRAFSTKISSVPLNALGTKTLQVPYIPAETAASIDFNAAADDCYQGGNVTVNGKTITLNRRKYQPWNLNSEEAATNTIVANTNFAVQKGRKLASDVLLDIFSAVTPANFPGLAFTGAANTFDSDDALDIRRVCDLAFMPRDSRSLILDSAYDTNLLKDTPIKYAQNYGSAEPIRQALIPEIAGFNEYGTTALPAPSVGNGNLVGMAVYPSALLVAMAPIDPLPQIKAQLAAFEIVTDPETDISMVYKEIVDAKCDKVIKLVECFYGFGVGETAALQRIRSAA